MSILIKAAETWIGEHAPQTWDCPHLTEKGLKGLFFESVPFKGKPTRVFAWLGLPEGASAEKPVPAVVLVHGGGGTAFARWVRWWNQRGYAAIAMDTCGAMPTPDTGALGSAPWPRHSHSGPQGWGGWEQAEWAPEDQWCYHAPAAVIKAHSLLASLPEVDAARIGMTGISWGGYLTCLVAGLDPRFRGAAPVYGCGYVSDASTWTESGMFDKLTDEQAAFWRANFDPARVLSRAKLPMLWLAGTNDFAYWPIPWQQSIDTAAGPHQLCMKVRWPHGHIPEGEETREIETFFAAHLTDATPMLSVDTPQVANGVISASYGEERPLRCANVVVTVDQGRWPQREWHTLPAEVDATNRRISAQVPEGTSAAFLSLISADWLTTSSELSFLKP
jgi:dienelactone hydrolase